jgi:hypothetical protein
MPDRDLVAHRLPADWWTGPAGGRPPLNNHDILKVCGSC